MINRTETIVMYLLLTLATLSDSAIAETRAQQPEKRPLSSADGSKLRIPGGPRISPDGHEIVFELNGVIYAAPLVGLAPKPLTQASSAAWGPRWSSNGANLYFNSSRSGANQIWKLPAASGGNAVMVTKLMSGISYGEVSPDESKVLLTLAKNELRSVKDDVASEPFVIDRRQFKRDADRGYLTDGDVEHLYLYNIESGLLSQLTSGSYVDNDASWSSDSSAVVFVSGRDSRSDSNYRTDIWVATSDHDGNGEANLRRLTDDPRTKHSPTWSPDGSVIAYISSDDGVYGLQHITIVPATGGSPKILTGLLDRWITSFQFSADSQWIYFDYDNDGRRHLARIRLRDQKIETLVDGDVYVSSFSLSSAGELAIALNRQNDTAEIYRLDDDNLQRLTRLNKDWFSGLQVGEKKMVSFESADGTTISAFVTTPFDYDSSRRYPAILNIHGGPTDQIAWGYDFGAQYMAANGYVVIEPNPRGSTGRGQAFARAIYRAWGVSDYDDVIAAIDYAVDNGYADPARLAVTGYSYGGYMTNVIITRTTRFKAAAAGAGHSFIAANVGHDIHQQWYSWELGLPWENPELYDKLSPLLRAGNVETPTLFLGGREDWNVPILNAELFYQALKMKGVDTRLIVYPDTHHSGWSDDFNRDYLQRVVAWFDRYVKSD